MTDPITRAELLAERWRMTFDPHHEMANRGFGSSPAARRGKARLLVLAPIIQDLIAPT